MHWTIYARMVYRREWKYSIKCKQFFECMTQKLALLMYCGQICLLDLKASLINPSIFLLNENASTQSCQKLPGTPRYTDKDGQNQ